MSTSIQTICDLIELTFEWHAVWTWRTFSRGRSSAVNRVSFGVFNEKMPGEAEVLRSEDIFATIDISEFFIVLWSLNISFIALTILSVMRFVTMHQL